jgi:hypothetical protein
MKTIECQAHIDQKRRAVLRFPEDVEPGEHRMLIILDAMRAQGRVKPRQGRRRDPISAVRGMLKGTSFNTRRYLQMKKEDKELER